MPDLEVPSELRDLPPSCKLVYLVLQEAGPSTGAELAKRTKLPTNTVYKSLGRLETESFVGTRQTPRDARSTLYYTEKFTSKK